MYFSANLATVSDPSKLIASNFYEMSLRRWTFTLWHFRAQPWPRSGVRRGQLCTEAFTLPPQKLNFSPWVNSLVWNYVTKLWAWFLVEQHTRPYVTKWASTVPSFPSGSSLRGLEKDWWTNQVAAESPLCIRSPKEWSLWRPAGATNRHENWPDVLPEPTRASQKRSFIDIFKKTWEGKLKNYEKGQNSPKITLSPAQSRQKPRKKCTKRERKWVL